MKKVLRLIGINILVLVALMMVVDFFSMILLNIEEALNYPKKYNTYLLNLPNYRNSPWKEIYFNEINKKKSEYYSYYGWRLTEFKGKTINIDSLGIRKTTGLQNKESPTAVFLGGSTMWGSGSNDDGTIPSIFNKKTKGKYYVLNYGDVNYTAYQSFIFLQTQFAKGLLDSIKLIVTYDGVNNDIRANRSYFSHHRENQIRVLLNGRDKKRKYYFMSNTRILIKGFKVHILNITPKYPKYPKLSDLILQRNAKELLESWMLIKTMADTKNAKFMCILQPNVFTGNPNIENVKKYISYPYKDNYKYYKYVKKFINENERYSTLKPHFIDMTNVLDSVPNVYFDFCHLSPNGNEIIVDNLLKHLNSN